MNTTRKVFVTGGTGFLGTRLVAALVDRGHSVRVLARQETPKPPPGLGDERRGLWQHPQIELVRGDLADRDALRRGMEGCSQVYHLAGYAKNWAPQPQTYFDVNVHGMQNVFDAAAEAGVERVVWTSTIVTFGPSPPGLVADENTHRRSDRYFTEYEETKTIAEGEAIRRAREGFPVVIVNPTRVFGPGHLTEGNVLSRLIDDYARGRMPFLLNRGVNVGNYVLVDDVVQGHVLAMEKGRVGERYILGGENVSLVEFLRVVDRVSGKRHWKIPLFTLAPMSVAWLLKTRARWFGAYPQITPGWVRTFATDWAFSCEKARRELGYRPTPLVEAVRATYEWLQQVRKESR